MTCRAGATVGSLILIVVSGAAALIPGAGRTLAGRRDPAVQRGALALAVQSGVQHAPRRPDALRRGELDQECARASARSCPFTVGAVFLLTGSFTGLYWVAAGVLVIFIISVANTWVVLVEILR